MAKALLALGGNLGPVRDTYLNEKLRLTEQEVATATGDEARRLCRIVSAKPTVPLRPSLCKASARLNSWRTYSVTSR